MKPLLPVLLLSCISCSAQVSFTVKAGVGLSYFKNYRLEPKQKVGLLAGMASNIRLSDHLSIQPEIIYDQKGTIFEDKANPPGSSDFSYEVTWHYVNVPLLLKARAYKNFFIEFGPSASLLLRADFVFTNNNFVPVDRNQTELYSKVYAGLNSGICYRYKKLEAGIRYSIGLTEVKLSEKATDPEFDHTGILPVGKHRVFQFTIGYEFHGSRKSKSK